MAREKKQTEAGLQRDSSTPLYAQLRDIIRGKISSEEWPANHIIPSENELSRKYGISRMTARSVIMQLVSEDLLYRVPGKGTFVRETKIEMSSLFYAGIRSQLEEKGYEVKTKLVDASVVKSGERIARKLGVAAGESVYEVRRIRSINRKPISYHLSYVPVKLAPDLIGHDLINEQLCQILSDHYALARGRVEETLESYAADAEKAELLGVAPGFPLLLLQDLISTGSGQIYEYTQVYFRGDKITIKLKF